MIDLNKAKKRLQEIQSQANRRDYSKISYSLKQGKNELRFITKPGEDWPFLYGSIYYKVKKQYFISPEMYDQPDPIMEALNALRDTGNEENAAFAKKHYPSRRVFALAVVRDQEDKGAVWIDFPPKIEKELVGYIMNQDYGDITDVQNGRDFTITKTKGNPFPEYLVQPKGKPTPLAGSKQAIEQVLNNTPDFKDAYKHHTYEEMASLWQKYLSGEQDVKETVIEQPVEQQKVDIAAALANFKKKKLS